MECTGAKACVAVGSYFKDSVKAQVPLAASWNGKAWRLQPVPAPAQTSYSQLYGVSCVRRAFCSAVGSDVLTSERWITLAEVWRGKRWEITPTPPLESASHNSLRAVSCSSPADCMAVGSADEATVPHPTGQPDSSLTAVACSTAHRCKAVGEYFTKTGPIDTFAESWNGRTWVLQPTVNPSETNNSLSGLACTSATACTAVGGYAGPESVSLSLIERYSAAQPRA